MVYPCGQIDGKAHGYLSRCNRLSTDRISSKTIYTSTYYCDRFIDGRCRSDTFMLFGYARVSTQDQNLALQLDDLKKAGCQKIFQEKVSSAKIRPQLQKMLEVVREGDTIIVWKLDRLGRSLKELFTFINDFQARDIGFRSLNDAAPRCPSIPLLPKAA